MAGNDEILAAIKALESGGPTQRRGAAVILGQWNDTRAIKPLVKAIGDEDSEVYQKAMEALTKFGNMAVETLLESLKHLNSAVRWRTIEILGKIGDDRAVGPICRVLKEDKVYHVRCIAVEALQRFGNVAIGPITEALKDNDWNVRWKAVQALERIGDINSIEQLALCKYDASKFVRNAASQAIEKLSRKKDV